MTHIGFIVPGCIHENKKYSLNDTWNETACKKCHCTADGVYCTYDNCSQLEECEVTYVPEGACCPVCLELAGMPNRPDGVPLVTEDSGCITEDGLTFNAGEMFKPGACRICICKKNRMICEEKTCEPLVCGQDQVYSEAVEGECCPKCIGK